MAEAGSSIPFHAAAILLYGILTGSVEDLTLVGENTQEFIECLAVDLAAKAEGESFVVKLEPRSVAAIVKKTLSWPWDRQVTSQTVVKLLADPLHFEESTDGNGGQAEAECRATVCLEEKELTGVPDDLGAQVVDMDIETPPSSQELSPTLSGDHLEMAQTAPTLGQPNHREVRHMQPEKLPETARSDDTSKGQQRTQEGGMDGSHLVSRAGENAAARVKQQLSKDQNTEQTGILSGSQKDNSPVIGRGVGGGHKRKSNALDAPDDVSEDIETIANTREKHELALQMAIGAPAHFLSPLVDCTKDMITPNDQVVEMQGTETAVAAGKETDEQLQPGAYSIFGGSAVVIGNGSLLPASEMQNIKAWGNQNYADSSVKNALEIMPDGCCSGLHFSLAGAGQERKRHEKLLKAQSTQLAANGLVCPLCPPNGNIDPDAWLGRLVAKQEVQASKHQHCPYCYALLLDAPCNENAQKCAELWDRQAGLVG